MITSALYAVVPLMALAMLIRGAAGWHVIGTARFFGALIWGAVGAAGIAAVSLNYLLDALGLAVGSAGRESAAAMLFAPPIEEFLKCAGLMVILAMMPIALKRHGAALGACVGIGFAMTENLLYFTAASDALRTHGYFEYMIQRTIFATMMHALGPAIVGSLAGKFHVSGLVAMGPAAALGTAIAVGIHFAWNLAILGENTMGIPPMIPRAGLIIATIAFVSWVAVRPSVSQEPAS